MLQLGQFFAARAEFVPEPICRKLSLLHDRVNPLLDCIILLIHTVAVACLHADDYLRQSCTHPTQMMA